jgi:hypothetical protein
MYCILKKQHMCSIYNLTTHSISFPLLFHNIWTFLWDAVWWKFSDSTEQSEKHTLYVAFHKFKTKMKEKKNTLIKTFWIFFHFPMKVFFSINIVSSSLENWKISHRKIDGTSCWFFMMKMLEPWNEFSLVLEFYFINFSSFSLIF